jgi:hypothetical protein
VFLSILADWFLPHLRQKQNFSNNSEATTELEVILLSSFKKNETMV